MAKEVYKGPGGGVETLPPAGDARREVLAERADDLAQKAEELGKDGGEIRPDALEIDNEIGRHFNEMEPPHARSGYVYKWEYCGMNQKDLRHVLASQSLGWERVTYRDEDAAGLEHFQQGPEGSVLCGDTLLMRIRRDRYIVLRRREYVQTQRQEQAVERELKDKSERYGVRIFGNEEFDKNGWTPQMDKAAQRAKAMQIANQMLDHDIRQGTVRGLPPAPRSR